MEQPPATTAAEQVFAGVQGPLLRDLAVRATRLSFTISDPNAEGEPLIWVNPAFTETTGYTFDEAVGRNCRFLQGAGTDPDVVAGIRADLDDGRAMTSTLLNYRKDGTPFWNELSISPIHDEQGRVTHFVGVQADVTARVEAQQERDRALAQVAAAADRLALLADVTSRMAMTQLPMQILQLLGDALVPQVGTWCAIHTLDAAGRLARPYVVHERAESDAQVAALIDEVAGTSTTAIHDAGLIRQVLDGRVRDALIPDFTGEQDPGSELLHRLDTRSVVVVPLLARSGILGCVAVMTDSGRPPLGESELSLVQDLAVRAGLMLENTQLYARERAAAATLQRSLLPRLPTIDGLTVAADYVPAADQVAVGGDWYDAFAVRGGAAVGVVVGDVMGHDIDSAARMGKLSTIVRSYGWPGSDPQVVLTAVDELLESGGLDFLATCFYATLVREDGPDGGAVLHYASAGHPPAILRDPDGVVSMLEGGHGTILGVSRLRPDAVRRPAATVSMPRGSTLICFTDGLIDAFGPEPDLDEGLAEICRRTAALPLDATPRRIIDTLTGAAARRTDDIAVVAIRVD